MVAVTVRHLNTNTVTIECPLCGERVVRDRIAFIYHMVNEHSATESTFDTVNPTYGGIDSPVFVDGRNRYPIMCYGCGSTFDDEDNLASHLEDEHDAV